MCYGCWQEMGKPRKFSNRIRKTARLLRECNPYGACHIVVEDWNLRKRHISFCLTDERITPIERKAMLLLLSMGIASRGSAMARAENWHRKENIQ